MNKFTIVVLSIAAVAMAVPMSDTNDVHAENRLDCFDQETALVSCLFVKSVGALSRAARSNDIEIIDGVKFVRETPMERNGKDLKTELDIMNELPRDGSDRAIKLASMLFESAVSFAKSHSLKLSMPEEGSLARALDEGRAKIKKIALPLIAAAGVKLFALVPILLGSLGLLVMKALFVGKIALLLAGVLAFQRLFGSGSGSGAANFFSKNAQSIPGWLDGSSQGWSAGAATGVQPQGYYKRSFNAEKAKDAHLMAYAAQVPATNETD